MKAKHFNCYKKKIKDSYLIEVFRFEYKKIEINLQNFIAYLMTVVKIKYYSVEPKRQL